MSYDPDDFDNNPFAQPQEHDVLNNDEFKPETSHYDNPYGEVYGKEPLEDSEGTSYGVGPSLVSPDRQNQELPKLPDEEGNNNEQKGSEQLENQLENEPMKEFKPDMSLLPERRSKKNYKITIKVMGIERVAKKDPIIKFDAHTNLPNFRGTIFKDIRRSHYELEKFFEYLNGANPECFVPALPPAQTSYGAGSEEDETTLTRQLQDWFDKITSNPILIRNEEFVFFVENDFGYTPINKGKVPATGLKRKTLKQFQPPYDEVTQLVEFRPYVKSVYVSTQNIVKTFEKLTKLKKNYGLHVTDLGNKIVGLASLETLHPGMVNLWQKFGKSMVVYGDIEAINSVYEMALFGDEIKLLSSDAYVFKEQLTNRHLLMRELANAEQVTRSKHAQALRAKTRKYEDPIKIDQIIGELEQSKKVEDILRLKVKRISSNMLLEKKLVLANQQKKLRHILRDYTVKVIENQRKILSNFEKIRIDVRLVDENGGLSRLGRENYPRISSNIRNSQRYDGDDWSGDRKHKRASSAVSTASNDSPVVKNNTAPSSGTASIAAAAKSADSITNNDDDEISNLGDARSAATLLGTLTF